jgi:hypothetical protein
LGISYRSRKDEQPKVTLIPDNRNFAPAIFYQKSLLAYYIIIADLLAESSAAHPLNHLKLYLSKILSAM